MTDNSAILNAMINIHKLIDDKQPEISEDDRNAYLQNLNINFSTPHFRRIRGKTLDLKCGKVPIGEIEMDEKYRNEFLRLRNVYRRLDLLDYMDNFNRCQDVICIDIKDTNHLYIIERNTYPVKMFIIDTDNLNFIRFYPVNNSDIIDMCLKFMDDQGYYIDPDNILIYIRHAKDALVKCEDKYRRFVLNVDLSDSWEHIMHISIIKCEYKIWLLGLFFKIIGKELV